MVQFIASAATYQITTSAKIVAASGAWRSIRGWRARDAVARSGSASELLVIGMSCAQPGTDALGDSEKLRRLADLQRPVARKIAVDDIDDAAGTRRHHHDPARKEHRFRDRMGDEQHG